MVGNICIEAKYFWWADTPVWRSLPFYGQKFRVVSHYLAYLHCRIRLHCNGLFTLPDLDSDSDSDSKPMVTLYYVKIFTLVLIWIQIPVRRVSRMVTVPILGMDLHPRDRCSSLFHTFQSRDQSLDLNQCEISA